MQYQLGIVSCKTVRSSIARLLGSTLSCGTLALTVYSLSYATCVPTTAHAILGADNHAIGASFSEAAKAVLLSNHLELMSLCSLLSLCSFMPTTTGPFVTIHRMYGSLVSRREL